MSMMMNWSERSSSIVDDGDLQGTLMIGEALVLAVPTVLVPRSILIEREEDLLAGTSALDVEGVRDVPGLGRDEEIAHLSHPMAIVRPAELTAIESNRIHLVKEVLGQPDLKLHLVNIQSGITPARTHVFGKGRIRIAHYVDHYGTIRATCKKKAG